MSDKKSTRRIATPIETARAIGLSSVCNSKGLRVEIDGDWAHIIIDKTDYRISSVVME